MAPEAWLTEADDGVLSEPGEQNSSKLQRISETHQKVDEYWETMEQLAEGRPTMLWSPCGRPECTSWTCIPSPTENCDLYFRTHGKGGQNGPTYVRKVINTLGDVIWPGARNHADEMSRQMILGSFFKSPPVRGAYSLFKEAAPGHFSKSSLKRIQTAICEATPFVERLISQPDLSVHHHIICWYLGPDFMGVGRDHRSLGDAVVRYMLCCEMWRRYPSDRSKAWEFGPARTLCDLYGAMILAMRVLDDFGLTVRRSVYLNKYRNMVWGQWIEEFPLSAVHDNPYVGCDFIVRSAFRPRYDKTPGETEAKVLEDVGYLGGIGTYEPRVYRKLTRRVVELHIPDAIF